MRNLMSLLALCASVSSLLAQSELEKPGLELNGGSVELQTADETRFATQSLDQTRAWQGVGRVNVGARGFCTGTLIAPDLVLTAAHCFFNSNTKAMVPVEEVEFLAGWRSGRAAAYRRARQVVLHPDYSYEGPENVDGVAQDLALIRLDQPIRNPSVLPFKTSESVIEGATVKMVSYAKHRADAPSLQDSCAVLATDPGVYVTSCNVDFGSSGAPVFMMQSGEPYVLSVVSAKAEWRGQDVSLTAGVYSGLDALIDELERADGVFRRAGAASDVFQDGTGVGTDGVEFLRP